MVASVTYVWALVAQLLLPAPGFGQGLLDYVASFRSFFILSYVLFTLANSLSIVGIVGIYAATRSLNRSFAMLGAATSVIGLVTTLLSNEAPALITLSYGYSSAVTDAERQAFITASWAVAATNNSFIASAFIGVGVIFLALAMSKAPFGRGLAYLGLVVGLFNIARALPFFMGYPGVTSTLFVAVSSVWIFGVGYRVYRQAAMDQPATS